MKKLNPNITVVSMNVNYSTSLFRKRETFIIANGYYLLFIGENLKQNGMEKL